MKKLLNILMKGLAGFMFIVLLALNVQVGNGNSFLGLGDAQINEAQADWCDPIPVFCTIDIFGNIIWGEFKEGVPPIDG